MIYSACSVNALIQKDLSRVIVAKAITETALIAPISMSALTKLTRVRNSPIVKIQKEATHVIVIMGFISTQIKLHVSIRMNAKLCLVTLKEKF